MSRLPTETCGSCQGACLRRFHQGRLEQARASQANLAQLTRSRATTEPDSTVEKFEAIVAGIHKARICRKDGHEGGEVLVKGVLYKCDI